MKRPKKLGVPEKNRPTYESEALAVLIYEFGTVSIREIDEKIKKRLKRKHLGEFESTRVNLLRAMKNELQKEIALQHESRYYIRKKQSAARGEFVEVDDFDVSLLISDAAARYPNIPKRVIEWFVPFSVFVNHLL